MLVVSEVDDKCEVGGFSCLFACRWVTEQGDLTKLLCLDTIWKLEDSEIMELFTGIYTFEKPRTDLRSFILCTE